MSDEAPCILREYTELLAFQAPDRASKKERKIQGTIYPARQLTFNRYLQEKNYIFKIAMLEQKSR